MRRILPLVGLCLLLCACGGTHLPYRVQRIENLELIRAMGVDTDPAGVRVTLGGGRHPAVGGEPEPPVTVSGAAETISLAARELQTGYDRYMFYGHVGEYLIGEALAAQGFAACLDYIERSIDLRLNANLYIVKGGTAKGMITGATGSRPVNERLESLKETAGLTSDTYPFTVRTALTQMELSGSALCPALILEEEESEGETTQQIRAAGYAVITEGTLAGYLCGEAAKGVNLLLDLVTTDLVALRTEEGVPVSVQVARSVTRVRPVFEAGGLRRVRIHTKIDANIAEAAGTADLADPALAEELARQLEDIQRDRMKTVVERAQAWESDFLSIGSRVARAAPAQWGALRDDWAERFPDLEIEIEVEAVIRHAHNSDATAEGRKT